MIRARFPTLLRRIDQGLLRIQGHDRHRDFSHQRLLVVANHKPFIGGLLADLFLSPDPAISRDTWTAKANEVGTPELAIPRKIMPLPGIMKVDDVTLKQMLEAA